MSAVLKMPERAMEFAFTEADRAAIADFVYAEAGIVLPAAKAQLIYGRVAPLVRNRGLRTVAEYVTLMASEPDERILAIDALTTNHTSFFREAHHFDHFMADAWPKLEKRLMERECVRIWSAACSSGEEPYTLLMAILGTDRNAAKRLAKANLKMLATDLSTEILETAKAGHYSLATAKSVPAELRHWMTRNGDVAEVAPFLRDRVTFRKLNLLKDWPMRQSFDAIFCRNVMIYFDEPTKERLQTRLADQLAPGGFLYLGHSERLSESVAPRFKCVGRTTFQKVAA